MHGSMIRSIIFLSRHMDQASNWLDEAEKAHPDIFNIPLQVFENGHLTGSHVLDPDIHDMHFCSHKKTHPVLSTPRS